MDAEFPYRYVAIEGPIAAGKTTLAKLLSKRFRIEAVLEDLNNPFLAPFYRDPKTHRLSVQLYFLITRHLVQFEIRRRLDSGAGVVSDFMFWKEQVFSSVNLTKPEMRIYDRMWSVLVQDAVVPDVVVWLDAPEEFLFNRIWRRGRRYEEAISLGYLEKLRRGYAEFFESWHECDVIRIRSDRFDFEHDPEDADAVVGAILDKVDLT